MTQMQVNASPDARTPLVRPNLYRLAGGGITVTYHSHGSGGASTLTYRDSQRTVSFRGDEIRRAEVADLGTVISVTLDMTVDLGSATFTLLLPHVDVSGEIGSSATIHAEGITTTRAFSLVPGLETQHEVYSSTHLEGTACLVKLTGSLTVFAAASLTEAFNDTKTALENEFPGLTITYSFAGSQELVAQILNGASSDVVATADMTSMNQLVAPGLVDSPTVLAHNKLEIVVAPGNPKGVNGLVDLARTDLAVVLADASVPVGRYARQALQKAGVTVNPTFQEPDVKSVLNRVATGDADAGIVYVTDVTAAGSAVSGVAIPDAQNVIATYPIAVVSSTMHAPTARSFVEEILYGDGQEALQARGFTGP